MDIQKIIDQVVAKIKADPKQMQSFLAQPAKLIKDWLGVDVDPAQIVKIVDAVKGQIDVGQATGFLAKLKRLFGMK